MPAVSSRQHAIVKQCRAIVRGDDPHLLLDGWHLVRDAAAAGLAVAWVAIEVSRPIEDGALIRRLEGAGTTVVEVTASVMQALSPVRTTTGIVGVAVRPEVSADALLAPPPPLVLAALGLQDPGNVGAVIRSADAAGATGVLLDTHAADPWGWKALRASMGSTFRLPVHRAVDARAQLATWRQQGVRTVAADPRATDVLQAADLTAGLALLLGAEGHGLPDDVLASADARVRIPMRPGVESLNAAVAAALLLYEAARQRRTLS